AALVVVQSVESCEVAEVLHAAHLVVEKRGVGHVAELAADLTGLNTSENNDRAAGGSDEPGEHAQESGLAGAVVAQNSVKAPGGERRGHAAQRGKAPELLDQVCDGNDRVSLGMRRLRIVHSRIGFVREANRVLQGHTFGNTFPLGHALGRLGVRSTRGRIARLRGRVLGRALRLQGLGVEDAVFAEAAFSERLRVVFERVRRWLGASVADGQAQVLLYQNEVDVCATALDGSGLHVAGNPQTLGERAVAEAAQLLDSDVVALAFLDARIGEIAQHQENEYSRAAKLQILTSFTRHKEFPRAPMIKL